MKKKNLMLSMVFAVALTAWGCGTASSEMTETQAMEQVFTEVPLSMESEETSVVESTGEASLEQNGESGDVKTEEANEPEIIVEGNEGVIRIGTTGTPYTELLTQAKIQLAKKGWDLQIEEYTDYAKINSDVLEKNLDAHFFAHQTYVDSYNDVNGTDLISEASICYEKYGIYSKLNGELTNIKEGVIFALPEDATYCAKALLFLQDVGYITLKENVGLTAIWDDVIENPKNIQFVTYNQESIKEVLKTADYCVMGANQAILAGFDPKREVLIEETVEMEHVLALATVLVTSAENSESENLRILIEELKSETIKKYVDDTYKGAIGLFF